MLWCTLKFPLFSIIRGKMNVHASGVQGAAFYTSCTSDTGKEEEGGGPPPGYLFFLGRPLFLLGGSWAAAFSASLAARRVAWSGSSTRIKSTMSL